ncbi:Choline-sulfatase [Halorubrum sp. DM2]|uniref:sulfatase family protein n=1 Tax=Halorubrum sp. DM2 TaxID=2527867 RepID=UPI0024B8422F|nr:sulfatase [Halorubrum sp. DM2]VTT88167.1 Choline-sulfatase [Halorubrum sp. DM2]
MTSHNPNPPNVVVIVCDTLRPDMLSSYGGSVNTPGFDKIAANGTLFEQAYAAGPGSSISHGALFTGKYPSESGIVGQVKIPPEEGTVAEYFRKVGYETFGIPGPSRIGSDWGYDKGFDTYLEKWRDIPSSLTLEDIRKAISDPTLVEPMPSHFYRMAKQGNDKYTGYLVDTFMRKLSKDVDEPFFAFANFPFVHAPYDPPRPYKEQATPELRRPSFGALELLPWTEEKLDREDVRQHRLEAIQDGTGDAKFFADSSWLTDEEVQVLRDWYRASIKYLDTHIERIWEWLERTGQIENTVFAIMSDHGEYLGEHGLLKHMYFHFKEALHVPLIITGPSVPEGERRSDYVSLVDVFDTLCHLAGIERPESVTGHSVFDGSHRDAVFAENGIRSLPNFYQEQLGPDRLDEFKRGRKSIRTKDFLFTQDSAGEYSLFKLPDEELVNDPSGELVNDLRERLFEELGSEFTHDEGYGDNLDQSVTENLRELGYIE